MHILPLLEWFCELWRDAALPACLRIPAASDRVCATHARLQNDRLVLSDQCACRSSTGWCKPPYGTGQPGRERGRLRRLVQGGLYVGAIRPDSVTTEAEQPCVLSRRLWISFSGHRVRLFHVSRTRVPTPSLCLVSPGPHSALLFLVFLLLRTPFEKEHIDLHALHFSAVSRGDTPRQDTPVWPGASLPLFLAIPLSKYQFSTYILDKKL